MFLLNNLKGMYLYPHIISNTSIAISVSKVAVAAPFSAKKGIKDETGRSPLFYARQQKHTQIIKILEKARGN